MVWANSRLLLREKIQLLKGTVEGCHWLRRDIFLVWETSKNNNLSKILNPKKFFNFIYPGASGCSSESRSWRVGRRRRWSMADVFEKHSSRLRDFYATALLFWCSRKFCNSSTSQKSPRREKGSFEANDKLLRLPTFVLRF